MLITYTSVTTTFTCINRVVLLTSTIIFSYKQAHRILIHMSCVLAFPLIQELIIIIRAICSIFFGNILMIDFVYVLSFNGNSFRDKTQTSILHILIMAVL